MSTPPGQHIMEEDLAIMALAALAQRSRLRVFRALVAAAPEGLQPGQLSHTLGIPTNTLSFHLKELHHAGLVQVQRDGRFLHYSVRMSAMRGLLGFLTDQCCHGTPC
jgi:ArsR family transcriptional regulator